MENPFGILADSPTPVYEYNPVEASSRSRQAPINPAYIFQAVKRGDASVVEKALIHGASPDTIYRGNTILNHAIYYNHKRIVKLLINHGATPSLKSPKYNMDAYEEAKTKKEILDVLAQQK